MGAYTFLEDDRRGAVLQARGSGGGYRRVASTSSGETARRLAEELNSVLALRQAAETALNLIKDRQTGSAIRALEEML